MPLGMDIGLSPGHIVLDGDPAPLPKKGQSPLSFRTMSILANWSDGSRCQLVRIFGQCLLWPNGRPSHLLLSTFSGGIYTRRYRHFFMLQVQM